MSKAKYFNKGMAKGKVSKVEIVNYETKEKEKKHFLSMEIDTMDGNKAKITLFPPKSDPNRAKEYKENFPIGTIVQAIGRVVENEFTTKTGQKGIDRSISANKVELLDNDKYNVTFILQGIVESIRQIPDGALVKISHDENYVDENKNVVERDPSMFTLQTTEDLVFESGIEKGCNAKFKGIILNEVQFDDYGDIVGKAQMFKVEHISDVILKDDLVDDNDLEANPFE